MAVNYEAVNARKQALNKQVNTFESLLGYKPKTTNYTVDSLAGGGFISDDKAQAYGVDPTKLGYYVDLLDKYDIKIGDIKEGKIVKEFKPVSRIQQSGGGNTIYTKTVTEYRPVYEEGIATDRANLAMLAINEAKKREYESRKNRLESELGVNLQDEFKEIKPRFDISQERLEDVIGGDYFETIDPNDNYIDREDFVEIVNKNKKVNEILQSRPKNYYGFESIDESSGYDELFPAEEKLEKTFESTKRQVKRKENSGSSSGGLYAIHGGNTKKKEINPEDIVLKKIDLPFYENKLESVRQNITKLDTKVKEIKKTRTPQKDLDIPELSEYGDTSDYESWSSLQNTIATEQNKRIDEINLIQDPAERYVAFEQDLPLYDVPYEFVTQKLKAIETKAEQIKKTRTPQKDMDIPELTGYDDTADYDKLYGLQDMIITEKNKRMEEINLLQDPAEKFVAQQQDLPLYDESFAFANEKVTKLDERVSNIRSTRQPNISFDELGGEFKYNDLIDYRNELAVKQNMKINEINAISDPAERYVAIEQDFPIFTEKINQYDEKINQYGNILETRKPVDIKFKRDRKGSLEINFGEKSAKFRNTRRGIMDAEKYYSQTKSEYLGNISGIGDPVLKSASLEQDTPYLEYNEKVLKEQKKAQKNQQRQQMLNMEDSYAGEFGPTAPSDTPSGTLRVAVPPRNIVAPSGLGKIFGNNEARFPKYKEPKFDSDFGNFGFDSGKKQRKTRYDKLFG